MANPTSMTGGLPGVFTCTDAVAYCTVDPDRVYTFKHDGETVAGAASTDMIYLAFNGTAPDPDSSEGPNKGKLCSGDVLAIGPGITSLGFDMAAGHDATMTVIPGNRVDVGAGAVPDGVRAQTSGTEELTAEFGELTDATAVHLAAGPARALLTGGLVIDGVPAAETAGDIAALWLDLYRRLVFFGSNLAEGTLDVSVQSTPGKPPPQFETGWAATAAPADETPVIDVRNYAYHTVGYIIAAIGVSVDIIIWASLDGANFYPIVPQFQILAADPQINAITFAAPIRSLYCEHEAENGGAPTISFQYMGSN